MIKYDFLPYLSLQILENLKNEVIFHIILHNLYKTMQDYLLVEIQYVICVIFYSFIAFCLIRFNTIV